MATAQKPILQIRRADVVQPTLSTGMSDVRCSEDKFKCQLDRARATNLVQGVEAAVGGRQSRDCSPASALIGEGVPGDALDANNAEEK
jgi:hypothetical protein